MSAEGRTDLRPRQSTTAEGGFRRSVASVEFDLLGRPLKAAKVPFLRRKPFDSVVEGLRVWVSGETGIRTPDTGLTPYNGLANRRLQPLGHLSLINNKKTEAIRPQLYSQGYLV